MTATLEKCIQQCSACKEECDKCGSLAESMGWMDIAEACSKCAQHCDECVSVMKKGSNEHCAH